MVCSELEEVQAVVACLLVPVWLLALLGVVLAAALADDVGQQCVVSGRELVHFYDTKGFAVGLDGGGDVLNESGTLVSNLKPRCEEAPVPRYVVLEWRAAADRDLELHGHWDVVGDVVEAP